jgi:PAS domain-containing protein
MDDLTAAELRTAVERPRARQTPAWSETGAPAHVAALEAMQAPTVALDRSGRIIACNDAWRRASDLGGADLAPRGSA